MPPVRAWERLSPSGKGWKDREGVLGWRKTRMKKRRRIPRGHARVLRRVKSDLDARVEQDAIVVRGKQGVSGGFE